MRKCISEALYKKRADSNMRSYSYTILAYRFLHNPQESRGGGIGLLKSRLRARQLDHPAASLEQLWIDVKLQKLNILIGVTYRPKSVSPGLAMDCLRDSLSLLSPQYNEVFLLGDINVNCLGPSSHVITPRCFES